jgi:hypothetical protein
MADAMLLVLLVVLSLLAAAALVLADATLLVVALLLIAVIAVTVRGALLIARMTVNAEDVTDLSIVREVVARFPPMAMIVTLCAKASYCAS